MPLSEPQAAVYELMPCTNAWEMAADAFTKQFVAEHLAKSSGLTNPQIKVFNFSGEYNAVATYCTIVKLEADGEVYFFAISPKGYDGQTTAPEGSVPVPPHDKRLSFNLASGVNIETAILFPDKKAPLPASFDPQIHNYEHPFEALRL